MLLVIEKGKEDKAAEIAKKWDVQFTQVGDIRGDGLLKIWRHGKLVVNLDAEVLVLGGVLLSMTVNLQNRNTLRKLKVKN